MYVRINESSALGSPKRHLGHDNDYSTSFTFHNYGCRSLQITLGFEADPRPKNSQKGSLYYIVSRIASQSLFRIKYNDVVRRDKKRQHQPRNNIIIVISVLFCTTFDMVLSTKHPVKRSEEVISSQRGTSQNTTYSCTRIYLHSIGIH